MIFYLHSIKTRIKTILMPRACHLCAFYLHSIKTRIKTLSYNSLQLFPYKFYLHSIKTRIKTKERSLPLQRRSAYSIFIPSKQGLRHTRPTQTLRKINHSNFIPLEQGLRLTVFEDDYTNAHSNFIPLQQGLRRVSNAH